MSRKPSDCASQCAIGLFGAFGLLLGGGALLGWIFG